MVGALPTGRRLVGAGPGPRRPAPALLLDEPSSGLNGEETHALAALYRVIVDEEGLGVLLVEHDMETRDGDLWRIHVLDFGTIIATGAPEAVQRDAAMRRAYLGVDSPVPSRDDTRPDGSGPS
ncbi:MAG: hypothetical protein R2695_20760 [Acidimicrobiales bacterium]